VDEEPQKTQKVGVTLTLETIAAIGKIAVANNTSKASAIADSVKINEVLTEAERHHAKILLRYPDGSMKEIVRRPL
jgi:hypothetical protein